MNIRPFQINVSKPKLRCATASKRRDGPTGKLSRTPRKGVPLALIAGLAADWAR